MPSNDSPLASAARAMSIVSATVRGTHMAPNSMSPASEPTTLLPRAQLRLRPMADDAHLHAAYRDRMGRRTQSGIWPGALVLAVFQVVGSFGAAGNQPER